eukprot:3196143-Lingulodinium_polyedra.AAC.1
MRGRDDMRSYASEQAQQALPRNGDWRCAAGRDGVGASKARAQRAPCESCSARRAYQPGAAPG